MESFFKREIIITEDGSSSIYLPEFDEHYHSIHGAIQESQHVFMEMGWKKVLEQKKEIKNLTEVEPAETEPVETEPVETGPVGPSWTEPVEVLEVGFGTGLNAFLVLKETLTDANVKVTYTSLEAYPVSTEDALKLNYAEDETLGNYFRQLHTAKWNEAENITPGFTLKKIRIKLKDFSAENETYDLVFFDAFSPNTQPELWTEEVFAKLFAALKPGGILVTYCAKGQVRRNMQAAGFLVERLPGPPGKREMIRALKIKSE